MLTILPANLRTAASVFLVGLTLSAVAQEKKPVSVAKAQQRLLHLTVSDDMNTDVPKPVREGIVELKQSLAIQTDAIVARLPNGITAARVKQRLDQAMPPPSIGKLSDDQWVKRANDDSPQPVAGLFGGELTVSATMPKPSLLLVQEGFDIACGNDNILLVYSNAEGAWRRILLWQSKPYISVGEAFGDTYATLLLRPRHHGYPLLLVLHGHPWCTSTFSRFSMDIFELGASSNSVPLWHVEHGYRRLDLDPPLTLRATADGFEVRTSVSTAGERVRKGVLDAVVSRKGVMRYAVTSDRIHRVQPIAMNAHDSVEEWLEMPQTEAEEFADEPADSLTWTMFQEFTDGNKPFDTGIPFPGVGAVRSCKDSATHFQADVISTFEMTVAQLLEGV